MRSGDTTSKSTGVESPEKTCEQRSEDQYLFLLEHINDGILISRNESILYANTRLTEMLGIDLDALLSRPRSALSPAGAQSRQSPTLSSPIVIGTSQFETVLSHANGSEVPVEIAVSRGPYEGGEATFEVIRDISSRRKAQRRMEGLLRLGERLNHATTIVDVARTTMEVADELIGWDACSVETANERDLANFEPVLFIDLIDGKRQEITSKYHTTNVKQLAERLQREGPQLVKRGSDGQPTPKLQMQPFGDEARRSETMIFAPVLGEDQVLGVISLHSYQKDAYAKEELETLAALADHCSGALQRAIALRAVRDSEKRYRQMFERNQAIKLLVDPSDGSIVDANHAACRFYGYPHDKIRALKIWQLSNKSEQEIRELMQRTLDESVKSLEGKHRLASGETRDVEVFSTSIEDRGRPLLQSIVHDVTERNRALAQVAALAELGRRLSSATNSVDVGRILVDVADRLIGWDACFVDLFASETDIALISMDPKMLIPVVHMDIVDGKRREVPAVFALLMTGSISHRVIAEGPLLILREREAQTETTFSAFGDRERRSASLMYVPVRGAAGLLGIISLQSYSFNAYDTNHIEMLQSLADHCSGAFERTRAEEQVRLLESAIRLSRDMVFVTASVPEQPFGERIIYLNDSTLQLTGFSREELIGKSFTVLHGQETDHDAIRRIQETLRAGRHLRTEIVLYRKDGNSYFADLSGYPIMDNYQRARYFVYVCRDITEWKRNEQDLVYKAFHDPLTGLANRALMLERLAHAQARSIRSGEHYALLYLDLDIFKDVNDRFGHAVGDQLLVAFARRLEQCVRPGDTVARLGGDEFVVLLEGVDRIEDATHASDRILETAAHPHFLRGEAVTCTVSIGIAFLPAFAAEPQELLNNADAALYRAKANGKARYEIYTEPVSQ